MLGYLLGWNCRGEGLFQGSRLTFELASPVASDRFDPLAKTNFSLARCRHLLQLSEQRFSRTCEPKFLVLLFSSCPSVIMLRRNNTINNNAHECFYQVLTVGHTWSCWDMNCLSHSRKFGRGLKSKFQWPAENWGNVPALVSFEGDYSDYSRTWKVQSFHTLDSHRTTFKTSEIIRCTLTPLTPYIANIGIDVIIEGVCGIRP